jgi:stage V sporulation protein R
VFATQIMNEGWASYWHARLMREADFLPPEVYVDAIKCHSDVVRPIATGEQVALAVNPYHLGFSMWETIVEKEGLEAARRMMEQEDDFSFVRNRLTPELAGELGLFRYEADSTNGIRVTERDLPKLHDALLAPKYNFGAPRVAALHVHVDGTLELQHDHATDGRGLDLERARRVLEYVHRVWRRPVRLHTVGASGLPIELTHP